MTKYGHDEFLAVCLIALEYDDFVEIGMIKRCLKFVDIISVVGAVDGVSMPVLFITMLSFRLFFNLLTWMG